MVSMRRISWLAVKTAHHSIVAQYHTVQGATQSMDDDVH